ncbi:MAG: ribonuclease HII, partial [Treponema sp.]|nr:ribonuclease HII [Treponema sp.]
DAKYPSVMAASIIAKVARDRIMVEYDAQYPQYGYAKHKGYPTEAHRKVCRELGPSPIQRLTFTY